MSQSTDFKVVRLGGTIRVTHTRADGGQLEMSLTRGSTRSTALVALSYPDGRLGAVSARSWANQGDEPELARRMRDELDRVGA